jgi:hypothetical protein
MDRTSRGWRSKLDEMLGEQTEHFMKWLAHFYSGCLEGKPTKGLSLLIAGL